MQGKEMTINMTFEESEATKLALKKAINRLNKNPRNEVRVKVLQTIVLKFEREVKSDETKQGSKEKQTQKQLSKEKKL